MADYKREVSEEERQELREKCMKCKVILLESKGKHPLSNIALFTQREKDKFIKELDEMIRTWDTQKIDTEFNSIVCNSLLDGSKDISVYPVIETTPADYSVLTSKTDQTPDPTTE